MQPYHAKNLYFKKYLSKYLPKHVKMWLYIRVSFVQNKKLSFDFRNSLKKKKKNTIYYNKYYFYEKIEKIIEII